MERIPDTVDVAVITERLRPLAQQASEGLRHTTEGLLHTTDGLRQSLEHAREAIVDRLEPEAPVVIVPTPAAITLAARGFPLAARLRDFRRSPLEWLALAVATAVVAALAAFAIAAVARRVQARRASVTPHAEPAAPAEPVVIPISGEVADAAAEAGIPPDVEERVAEAG
jgi:hypothetical protein